jgi:hypothetical protein
MPASLVVGGCTSSRIASGMTRLRRVCRHLLSLLSRFAKRSRDERPDGSRLAFARDPVAWRLNPYPPRYRAAFASPILLYSQPRRLPLWLSCLRQGGTGTPAPATYLLVQACQHPWLVVSNGVYQRFTSIGHTIRPSSRTA